MDIVMVAHTERQSLSGSEPDAPCQEGLVSLMLTSLFTCPSAPSCFLEPPAGLTREAVQCHRKFQHPEGDHFTLINIYNAFKQSQKEQRKAQFGSQTKRNKTPL